MRLFIAEKPSLGRAIAAVMPKPHKKGEGYIEASNGDVVSWCIGHLLEQAEPEAYGEHYKKWQLSTLPIIPDTWKLKPKTQTKKQLAVLRRLVKNCDDIVHAGDPDREGQLLVDQVIDYLGVSTKRKALIQRCLISDLTPQAVERSLKDLRSNKEFVSLSVSALARSRADWLYGINMTRAYTLQGQKAGYQGVLSVGRVQTPVLGLVVRRDAEIAAFVSKPFYEVIARIKVLDSAEEFSAKWIPSEACEPYQDEEGRVLHRPLAENVALRITDQPVQLVSRDEKQRRQAPPLPYNLSALQIDAARRFGLSAKQVLDTSQSLYERHALITYPRSDCRYLPEGHFAQADSVCRAISHNAPSLAASVQGANTKLRSKAWSDKKVAAHHAIIPTAKRSSAVLSDVEVKVYDLICRQYVMQFYPDYRFSETQLNLLIAGGQFVAKARQLVELGWKAISAGGRSRKGGNTDDEQSELIPAFKPGQALHCTGGDVVDKETQPPQFFTDATLLAAMTGIARYVSDPELKKTLKETDGLGTEATRAGIIELLFTRSFLHRKGKQIRATEAGIQLIAGLPEVSTKPDITARWELALNAIVEKEMTYTAFMKPLETVVADLVSNSDSVSFKALPVSKRSFAGTGKKLRRKTPVK